MISASVYGNIISMHCSVHVLKRSASVSTKPTITYCLITAEVDVGSSVEKAEISCADESNPVVYSNVVATTVKVGATVVVGRGLVFSFSSCVYELNKTAMSVSGRIAVIPQQQEKQTIIFIYLHNVRVEGNLNTYLLKPA